MKIEILFAAMSLILLAGIVAVALPTPVQAAPKFTWCYTEVGPIVVCGAGGEPFNKHQCKIHEEAENPVNILEPCHKKPTA